MRQGAVAQATGPYVLNLSTTATPLALPEVVDRADLKGFTFFTSRSFEGGRERFRLHMGYFASLEEAQVWLATVRDVYPAAWAGRAPGRDAPSAARRERVPVSPEPAVPTPRQSPQLPRTAAPPTVAHQLTQGIIPSLPPRTPSPPVLSAYRREPVAGRSEPDALSDSGVLRVLEEHQTSVPGRNADSAPPSLTPRDTGTQPVARERVRRAPRYFAVELVCSPQPMEIEDVAPLPILDHYTIYTVEGLRAGERWYGVRVGFFTDVAAARQLADEVTSEFASVAVVPISVLEKRAASGEEGQVPPESPVEEGLERAWAPSSEELELVAQASDAQAGGDPEASGEHATLEESLELLGGTGEYPEDFLAYPPGARRRLPRLPKSLPFLGLLERLGARIKGS
jgi:hypothetical protein